MRCSIGDEGWPFGVACGGGFKLVTAVVARAPSYRWTAPLPVGPVAESFRARIAMRRVDLSYVHAVLLERRR